jgi:DNA repair protein RadC
MCSVLPCARAHASLPVVVTDDRFSYTRPPLVQEALDLLEGDVRNSDVLISPGAVRDYLRLLLGDRPHEVFTVVFLDAQHRVLDTLEMFRGTLTQSSVYPREILVEALARKAAAVILAHNHPSGIAEPSVADRALAQKLQVVLDLVHVQLLDHFVIARGQLVSFAERGLL